MPTNLDIFNSSQLNISFKEKLKTLVYEDSLGAYILSLANALSDTALYQYLEGDLKTRLTALSKKRPNSSADDDLVFNQLIDSNQSFPKLAQFKNVGSWVVQYNQIRSYRPARNASDKVTSIHKDFDKNGFHFNKPFLQNEKLISIKYNNVELDLFLNKFPFSQNHLLLLINPKACSPQFLTYETLKLIHSLSSSLKEQKNNYFAYNSIGSYASVNHLHFHFNQLNFPLPISNPHWTHNGGNTNYPIKCYKFDSVKASWELISKLHQLNQAYNLIIEKSTIYVLPRAFQGYKTHSKWVQNIAWFELAGVITLDDEKTYQKLSETMIFNELSKLNIRL